MTPTPDFDAVGGAELDELDKAILAQLRHELESRDPVPEGLASRAQFAMTVQELEAEVARIVDLEAAGGQVRSTDYSLTTSMSFASDELSVMLTVERSSATTATLRGWLDAPAEIEVRERSRTHTVDADAEGRFSVEGVERGLVQLLIRPTEQGSRPVITPAFEV